MDTIKTRLAGVRQQIETAMQTYGRDQGSVVLLAVSKTRPVDDILDAVRAGQRSFGENYPQEALEKIQSLRREPIEWHFIGRIQSNKTRLIAENFHWVHSVDSLKQAQRLNNQRPPQLPPLNICLQIKVDPETTKGGLSPSEAGALAVCFSSLPRLRLRGLMTLPAPTTDPRAQRLPFRKLRLLLQHLNRQGLDMDTLSMGMSGDLEAAIAEGSTIVRVGTAIFGRRDSQPSFDPDNLQHQNFNE